MSRRPRQTASVAVTTVADLEAQLRAVVGELPKVDPAFAEEAASVVLAGKLHPDSSCSRRRGRHASTRPVVDAILDLFHVRYPEMKLSTRQTFYQIAQNYSHVGVPKTHKGYRQVRRLLVEMRRSGEIDDERVVDRTRGIHRLSSWAGPAQLIRDAAAQFRRDLWGSQPVIPLVGCEKNSLQAVFVEAVDHYGTRLLVNVGYASEHYYLDWAKQIREYHEHGKRTAVLFFADFDPSGCNAEEVLRHHVDRHLVKMGVDPEEAIESWTRVGLTFEDISAPDFFRLPVNRKDKRAPKYIARYGEWVGELDALPPDELRDLIRGAIARYITDQSAWDRIALEEQLQRESLNEFASTWDAIKAGTK